MEWEEARYEPMICQPPGANGTRVAKNRRCRTPKEQQFYNQQCAGRWRNRCIPTETTENNLRQFAVGEREYHKELVPTAEQIKAVVSRESSKKVSGVDKTNRLHATAEMIYSARTKEEKIVKGILDQAKGAHGFVPTVKEDDIIQLGCENVNSFEYV